MWDAVRQNIGKMHMKSKDMKSSSFLKQLRLAFIIIILIPVLGLGGIILYSSHRYIKEQRITEVKNTMTQNITALNGWATQCDSALRYLAGNYSVQKFLQMDETDYLTVNQELKSLSPILYNVLLTNQYCKNIKIYTDKQFHISTNWVENSEKYTEKSWYQEIMNTTGTVWWNEEDTLFMGRKIVSAYSKGTLGIVIVELKEEALKNNFLIFDHIPIQIKINTDENCIYEYGDENIKDGIESEMKVASNGWIVHYLVAQEYYVQNDWQQLGIPMVVTAVILLIAWIGIQIISRYLLKDLKALVSQVNEIRDGNFDVSVSHSKIEEINTLSESIETMLMKIKQLIRQVYAKEIEKQSLELDVLQAKINPHFLYNNLSAINWLAIDCGEEKISEITTEMATFYRTALNKGKTMDSISVEIANIQAYINLQLIAHENSFQAEYQFDEKIYSYTIPTFILQPLVENAIEHGIDELPERKGKIEIRIYCSEKELFLEVHDNGKELYEKIGTSCLPVEEYGYGTGNVNRRIQLLYGKEYGLQIFADASGTTSRISLSREELKKNIQL